MASAHQTEFIEKQALLLSDVRLEWAALRCALRRRIGAARTLLLTDSTCRLHAVPTDRLEQVQCTSSCCFLCQRFPPLLRISQAFFLSLSAFTPPVIFSFLPSIVFSTIFFCHLFRSVYRKYVLFLKICKCRRTRAAAASRYDRECIAMWAIDTLERNRSKGRLLLELHHQSQ